MRRELLQGSKRPWYLWGFSLVVLLIYVGGARDFWLILIGEHSYTAEQFGAGGVAYFSDYPLPLRLIWATNILCGLAAPMLLIANIRASVVLSSVSTSAQALLMLLTFALRDRWAMLGAWTSALDLGIGVVTGLFAWFSWSHFSRVKPRSDAAH